MGLATRLLSALREQAAALQSSPDLAAQAQVVSVALIGSLSRNDFRDGGSDVDLMIVHTHGDLPAAEVAAVPALRRLVHEFGAPLLQLGGGTGVQKPFVVDCHFVDATVLATQPQWSDPIRMVADLRERDAYLWLYAFDLEQFALPLLGPHPAHGLTIQDPPAYTSTLRDHLRADWQALDAATHGADADTINHWKHLSGRLMTAFALSRGVRSLMKASVHRGFNLLAPHFAGKDFAASLWAEYLYGTVFQDRDDWLRRCRRFCANGLEVL